jgi:hypothetical protein
LRGCRVTDDLAVLVVDHLAPRSGRDLRFREGVERVLINLAAARPVFAGERWMSLDRVYDIADARAFGDAVNVGHGSIDHCGSHLREPSPLEREVKPSKEICATS